MGISGSVLNKIVQDALTNDVMKILQDALTNNVIKLVQDALTNDVIRSSDKHKELKDLKILNKGSSELLKGSGKINSLIPEDSKEDQIQNEGRLSKKSIWEHHCEIEQENQSRNDHKPHTVLKVFFWGFKEDLIYLFQNKFFV